MNCSSKNRFCRIASGLLGLIMFVFALYRGSNASLDQNRPFSEVMKGAFIFGVVVGTETYLSLHCAADFLTVFNHRRDNSKTGSQKTDNTH